MKPDTKFQSVRELRREFNISQATVDKAMYELENEGFIYKEPGRGTFVADRSASEIAPKGAIALIIPQINNSSFFSDIAQGVENKIFELGYQMVLCSSYENIKREKQYIKRLVQNNTEGIIYASSSSEPDELLHLDEIASQMPLTVIDVELKNINCDYITTDDETGAYEAVTHLINRGRKKIAVLTVLKDISTMVKRIEGYKKALRDNGISLEKNLILNSTNCDFESGYNAMKDALNFNFEADALFCASDNLASGALQALYERKIKIPEDISVMGYGDLELNNPYNLALSSVAQPRMEMGRKAVELLNEKLENKRPLLSYKEVILPTKLKIKET
jgi:LacI family transcriptional regulator